MAKKITWFLILLKKHCRKKSFWCMCFLLIFSVYQIEQIALPDDENYNVGFYSVDSEYGSQMFASLNKRNEEYNYVLFQSEKDLEEAVVAGRVKCGFALCNDFDEKVSMETEEQAITFYVQKKDAITNTIFHTIYAAFLQEYGQQIILDHEEKIFGTVSKEREQKLKQNYKDLFEEQALFGIKETVVYVDDKEQIDSTIWMIRGIVGLFVFICLFFICVEHCWENEEFIGAYMAWNERWKYILLDYITGILGVSIVGFLVIRMTNPDIAFGKDIIAFTGYVGCSILWILVLDFVCKNKTRLFQYGMGLMVLQIILCPMFFDLSEYIGAVKWIRMIFPMGIYMNLLKLLI